MSNEDQTRTETTKKRSAMRWLLWAVVGVGGVLGIAIAVQLSTSETGESSILEAATGIAETPQRMKLDKQLDAFIAEGEQLVGRANEVWQRIHDELGQDIPAIELSLRSGFLTTHVFVLKNLDPNRTFGVYVVATREDGATATLPVGELGPSAQKEFGGNEGWKWDVRPSDSFVVHALPDQWTDPEYLVSNAMAREILDIGDALSEFNDRLDAFTRRQHPDHADAVRGKIEACFEKLRGNSSFDREIEYGTRVFRGSTLLGKD